MLRGFKWFAKGWNYLSATRQVRVAATTSAVAAAVGCTMWSPRRSLNTCRFLDNSGWFGWDKGNNGTQWGPALPHESKDDRPPEQRLTEEELRALLEAKQQEMEGRTGHRYPKITINVGPNKRCRVSFQLSGGVEREKLVMGIVRSIREMMIAVVEEGPWNCVQLADAEQKLHVSVCFRDQRSLPGSSPKATVFSFEKSQSDPFSVHEANLIRETYELATRKRGEATAELEKLGAELFRPDQLSCWDDIAGYEHVKEAIQSNVIYSLQHPEVYDEIAEQTRVKPETNRPRAILFEGPPGTGKTLTARVIASTVRVPLIYVPIERVMSKWFGESENMLARIFEAAGALDGAIVFIDEIDSLATSRSRNETHEATRRLLSVLLRHIEGFKSGGRSMVIGTTNRKRDLDAALVSRFDVSLDFPLPNEEERSAIFALYSKHLSSEDHGELAHASAGVSGRDIRDVCALTERKWAAQRIRKEVKATLPPMEQYLTAIHSKVIWAGRNDVLSEHRRPQEEIERTHGRREEKEEKL